MNKLIATKVFIDLANIDGLHPKEIKFIIAFIDKHYEGQDAKSLITEMTNPKESYLSLFKQVESYFERNLILDFSRVLLNIDGHFSKEEKTAYEHLRDHHQDISKDIIHLEREASADLAKEAKDLVYLKQLVELGKHIQKHRHIWLYRTGLMYIDISPILGLNSRYKKYAFILLLFCLCFFVFLFNYR